MVNSTILKIFVGKPAKMGVKGAKSPLDRLWESSIVKNEVDSKVWVGKTNISGDEQTDTKIHGGPDKAILCYSADHYKFWYSKYESKRGRLRFGENLLVSDLHEGNVCIGDIFLIGDKVQVQVSEHRMPCWKLGRLWGLKELPKIAQDTGRMGWYMRVLQEGFIKPQDRMVLLKRFLPKWTIQNVNRLLYIDRDDLLSSEELAHCQYMGLAGRKIFLKRVNRMKINPDENRLYGKE